MPQNFFGRLAETERFISAESPEEREQYGKLRLTALDPNKLAYIFNILKPSLLTGGEDASVNMQKLRILSKIM